MLSEIMMRTDSWNLFSELFLHNPTCGKWSLQLEHAFVRAFEPIYWLCAKAVCGEKQKEFVFYFILSEVLTCSIQWKIAQKPLCEPKPKAMCLEQLGLLQGNCFFPHLLSLPASAFFSLYHYWTFVRRRQLIMEVVVNTNSLVNDRLVIH